MGTRGRRSGGGGRRTARLVFLVLLLVVLGLTFAGGVVTGRRWAERSIPAAGADSAGAGRRGDANTARAEGALGRRGRNPASEVGYPEIQEKLTFYQTLTAPLRGAPPAEPRPADRPGARRDSRPEPKPEVRVEPKPVRPALPEATPLVAPAGTPAPPATSYTVQVAAYKSRGQAEALRRELGAGAYVIEIPVESGTTYRVRLGAYQTRATAEAAAARLRAERALNAFVTAR